MKQGQRFTKSLATLLLTPLVYNNPPGVGAARGFLNFSVYEAKTISIRAYDRGILPSYCTCIAFFLPLFAGGEKGLAMQERADEIIVKHFHDLLSQGIEGISSPVQRSFDELGLTCNLPSKIPTE